MGYYESAVNAEIETGTAEGRAATAGMTADERRAYAASEEAKAVESDRWAQAVYNTGGGQLDMDSFALSAARHRARAAAAQ